MPPDILHLVVDRARRLARVGHLIARALRTAAVFLGPAAIVLALAVLAANWCVENEPVRASLPDIGNDFVVFQADERLFTLMAALNAAGYDDENNEEGMSPIRQGVRATLASQYLPSVTLLRFYFEAHPSQYVTWILQRGDPPSFQRAFAAWGVKGVPAFFFTGLDGTLSEFYREADIARLWREYKPYYEQEIERYRPVTASAVQQMLTYLRLKQPPTQQVVVVPNLLDAYWRGYGPRIGSRSYVIIGPSDTPDLTLVQHEALHPIVNPLIRANMSVIQPEQARRLEAELKPRVSLSYTDWETMLEESVIRAIGVRLLPDCDRTSYLALQESQGFMLVRPLAAKLEEYEKSDKTFADYIATLLGSLNDSQLALV